MIQIHLSLHGYFRRRTINLEIAGIQHTAPDLRTAGDIVELEAIAEHIGEVQSDVPG